MKAILTATLVLCACALRPAANAQTGLALSHDSFWQIAGREMIIHVAVIENSSGEDSPPLYLSIYAQSGAAFHGGEPGRLLARALIGVIPAQTVWRDVTVTTRCRKPGRGVKFTALLIETKNGKRYEMADYVSYTSSFAFAPKQNGGVGSDDFAIGRGGIVVSDGTTFSVKGRRATVVVPKLQSQREGQRTGPLRLTIYALAEPYAGGEATGRLLAVRPLGVLAPGDFFHNVSGRLKLKKPPKSASHLTLFIEEEQAGGFVPLAYINLPE